MVWGARENEQLNQLFKSNTINPDLERFGDNSKERNQYLFDKSVEHFRAFVAEGTRGRSAAIRRLRLKCLAYTTGKAHDGARSRTKGAAKGKSGSRLLDEDRNVVIVSSVYLTAHDCVFLNID